LSGGTRRHGGNSRLLRAQKWSEWCGRGRLGVRRYADGSFTVSQLLDQKDRIVGDLRPDNRGDKRSRRQSNRGRRIVRVSRDSHSPGNQSPGSIDLWTSSAMTSRNRSEMSATHIHFLGAMLRGSSDIPACTRQENLVLRPVRCAAGTRTFPQCGPSDGD